MSHQKPIEIYLLKFFLFLKIFFNLNVSEIEKWYRNGSVLKSELQVVEKNNLKLWFGIFFDLN